MRRLPRTSEGLIALVPVGVAALLIAFCLAAGAHLYASSAGSAALGHATRETCRDREPPLRCRSRPSPPAPSSAWREIGARPVRRRARAGRLRRRSLGVDPSRNIHGARHRGCHRNVTAAPPALGPNEVAMSRRDPAGDGLASATRSRSTAPTCGSRSASNTRRSIRSLLSGATTRPARPPPSGDPRPPWAVASPGTVAALRGTLYNEYRVVDQPLTLHPRGGVSKRVRRGHRGMDVCRFPRAESMSNARALALVGPRVAVRTTVERNLAPVTLTRSGSRHDRAGRRRRAAGPGPPARCAPGRPWDAAATDRGHVVLASAGAVAGGSVVGWFIAWSVISVFGPSSNLEDWLVA